MRSKFQHDARKFNFRTLQLETDSQLTKRAAFPMEKRARTPDLVMIVVTIDIIYDASSCLFSL